MGFDDPARCKYRMLLQENNVVQVVSFSGHEADRSRYVSKVFHTYEGAELALFGYRPLNGIRLTPDEQMRLISMLGSIGEEG